MNKLTFNSDFLLGLYLLLRQIELSIDRSFDCSWTMLVEFFSGRTPIAAVLKKLQNTTTIDMDGTTMELGKYPRSSRTILSSIVSNGNFLTEEELVFIYLRLKYFNELLMFDSAPGRDDLIKLRMDIYYAEELVKGRVEKKSLVGTEYVEHFNQNETLNCKGIEELIGRSWV